MLKCVEMKWLSIPRDVIMLLKLSILDCQSFVLHKIGKGFFQNCNGGVHIRLATSYDII